MYSVDGTINRKAGKEKVTGKRPEPKKLGTMYQFT